MKNTYNILNDCNVFYSITRIIRLKNSGWHHRRPKATQKSCRWSRKEMEPTPCAGRQ